MKVLSRFRMPLRGVLGTTWHDKEDHLNYLRLRQTKVKRCQKPLLTIMIRGDNIFVMMIWIRKIFGSGFTIFRTLSN
jgi:hypothetical protein